MEEFSGYSLKAGWAFIFGQIDNNDGRDGNPGIYLIDLDSGSSYFYNRDRSY